MLFCSLFLLTLLIWESEFIMHKFSDVPEPITKEHVEPLKPLVRIVRSTTTSTDRSTTEDDVKHKSEDNSSSEVKGKEIVSHSSTLIPEGFKYCPLDSKPCKKPKPYEKTKDTICYSSKSCDYGLVCCPDSCHEHKICKNKAKPSSFSTTESANSTNAHTELPSFKVIEMKVKICPKEESPCLKPADANETERYKCVDDECPIHFKCCEDSCFVHKICKQANETTTKMSVLVSSDDNDTDSQSTTQSVLTTAGSNESSSTVASNKTENAKEIEESKETETSTTKDKHDSTKKFLPITDKLNSDDPKECPAENLDCSSPLNENDTKQFDCDKKKCPENFFCCKDNCFAHKICKEPSSSTGSFVRSSRIREVCPAIEEVCVLPADIRNAIFCSAKENCTSGLKCCSDACFKRNVCKKPEILIEARVETCPEEPETCNAFLRDIKIHPRYICNANMSNCPEDYKCCSDKCHNADLCKPPDVHIVVKKLIPTTTTLNASQNATGPVVGNQNATIPQPGTQNATSSQLGAQNTTVSQTPTQPGNQNVSSQPGNQNASSSQPGNQNASSSQPGNQNAASSQPGNQNAASSQPGNQNASSSQPGNQNASSSQPGNQNAASSQPGNQNASSSQPGNQNAASSQPGNQNAASSQSGNQNAPSSAPGNQNTASSIPGNQNAASSQPGTQPGKINEAIPQNATKNATHLDSVNKNPTTLQPGDHNTSGNSSSIVTGPGNSNLPTVQPENTKQDSTQSASTFPENAIRNQIIDVAKNSSADLPGNSDQSTTYSTSTSRKRGQSIDFSSPVKNPSAYLPGNPNPVNLQVQHLPLNTTF